MSVEAMDVAPVVSVTRGSHDGSLSDDLDDAFWDEMGTSSVSEGTEQNTASLTWSATDEKQVAEYMQSFGVTPTEDISTALAYGAARDPPKLSDDDDDDDDDDVCSGSSEQDPIPTTLCDDLSTSLTPTPNSNPEIERRRTRRRRARRNTSTVAELSNGSKPLDLSDKRALERKIRMQRNLLSWIEFRKNRQRNLSSSLELPLAILRETNTRTRKRKRLGSDPDESSDTRVAPPHRPPRPPAHTKLGHSSPCLPTLERIESGTPLEELAQMSHEELTGSLVAHLDSMLAGVVSTGITRHPLSASNTARVSSLFSSSSSSSSSSCSSSSSNEESHLASASGSDNKSHSSSSRSPSHGDPKAISATAIPTADFARLSLTSGPPKRKKRAKKKGQRKRVHSE